MGWGLGVVLGEGSGESENLRVGCPGFKGLRNGVRRCTVREDMQENSWGRCRARGWTVSSGGHPRGLGSQNMVFFGHLDGDRFGSTGWQEGVWGNKSYQDGRVFGEDGISR